jgi:predicted acetyltransferase
MILRPLTIDDELEATQAHRELLLDNFHFLLDPKGPLDENGSWSEYLERLELTSQGIALRPDWVRDTFLVAEVDGDIVGRVSIRHELNEYLLEKGGHIGFGVRPEYRRRGYAIEICAMALAITRSLGIERALITCNEGNIGSQISIERNGGVYESTFIEENGNKVRRYWVTK